MKQYADFKGRARRKEYWMFFLFNVIIAFALGLIDGVFGWSDSELGLGVLGSIYSLCVFVPSLSVSVRRLHDIGKSGWNYFYILIPIVGPIILIVWFFTEGELCSNKWGENPKIQN